MIVTFYSFKGGVGRSMAMAACAYLFAQRGLRTLAIDFDLEAPGLERYFFDDPAVLESVRARPGLIDLVLAYKRALTSKAEFERAGFKQWRDFVEEAIPATSAGGCVHLMTAGSRAPEPKYAEYALAVRSFDWQDFFTSWRGDRFFEWLRGELTAPDKGYDIVLVDSRTGVTEMGGVCAYQLADTAVLLCAANYQNLDGTKSIVDDFRSDAVMVVRQGRPIEIVVVPARIEDESAAVALQRDQFFVDFQRTFSSDGMPKVLADAGITYRNLALKYQPELAIIERLVDSETTALASFERLTDALTLLSSGERWEQLREAAYAGLSGHTVEAPVRPAADVTKRGAGYDLLIEYSDQDIQLAQTLLRRLVDRGISIWMRVDWENSAANSEILRALEYSAAVGVLIGKSEPTARFWEIFREAQVRRKRIVPILLPGADEPDQSLRRFGLSDYRFVDFRFGFEDGSRLGELLEILAGHSQSRAAPTAPALDVSPYPGASAFSEDQSAYFFGRERECEELLSAFDRTDVVVLSGPSGVGKTSIVQAGLVPRVRRGEGRFGAVDGAPWLVENLDASAVDFAEEVARASRSEIQQPILYIIDAVDRFAEVGDAGRWSARRGSIDRLLRNIVGPARFVLVWREALSADQREEALQQWSRGRSDVARVKIEPLLQTSLRDAMEKPAGRTGHLFEPGLVDRLLGESSSLPGGVAQLQRAMSDIWKGRRRGWLTNKAYDSGGGIGGRYAARLEEVLALPASAFGDALTLLLKSLVQLDRFLHVFSQPRSWDALSSIPALRNHDCPALVERLVRDRLVDIWRDDSGELLIGLSHSVIPTKLKELVGADAAFILWRQRLAAYVADYLDTHYSPASLLSGDILGEAERWLGTHGDQLTDSERSLIEDSKQARKRSEVLQRRRSRMKVVVAVVPIIVALTIAVFATYLGRQRALREVALLNMQYQVSQESLNEQRALIESVSADADAVRAQLKVATTPEERKALQGQLDTLNAKSAKAEAQAKRDQQELTTLRQNAIVSAAASESLVKERDTLRNTVEYMRVQLATLTGERDSLRKRAVTAEAAVAAAEATEKRSNEPQTQVPSTARPRQGTPAQNAPFGSAPGAKK